MFEPLQAHQFEQSRGLVAPSAHLAANLERQHDVIQCRPPGEKGGVLENESKGAASSRGRRVGAGDNDVSSRWFEDVSDDPKQCGLSTSRGTHE
jgi:hypothetical protein